MHSGENFTFTQQSRGVQNEIGQQQPVIKVMVKATPSSETVRAIANSLRRNL
jgi:hypothetical protein